MTTGPVELPWQRIQALLDDRLDGTGPCVVNESLPWPALSRTSILPGARILMEQLAGPGARLTPNGNLTRKLVGSLMDVVEWPGCDLEELRSISKVFNEEDFAPASYLHAILRVAGLARHEKGYLKLGPKGRKLLAEDQAGRLQALLFRTTFTRFNLGYLDRFGMAGLFSPQIPLTLYLIGKFCTDWIPVHELVHKVTLPAELSENHERWLASAFYADVLRYLSWFGLIEEAEPPRPSWRHEDRRIRKAPLYDRALIFVDAGPSRASN